MGSTTSAVVVDIGRRGPPAQLGLGLPFSPDHDDAVLPAVVGCEEPLGQEVHVEGPEGVAGGLETGLNGSVKRGNAGNHRGNLENPAGGTNSELWSDVGSCFP